MFFKNTAQPITWFELLCYCILVLTGASLRLWDLGSRAMHHDESLHAMYSYYLAIGDGYEHNPMMHGPLQFILNASIFFTFGDSDYTARVLYAIMGTVLIGLPICLRNHLGRIGTVLISLGLMISPCMLYFSRFARNDILMAVWTFGLVICMWRYFDSGRNRYLYVSSGLLALLFASKETAFIVTIVMGSYLVFSILLTRISFKLDSNSKPFTLQGLSPPQAITLGVKTIAKAIFIGGSDFPRRQISFLTLLGTLSIVQWSASIGYFQNTVLLNWSNLTLTQPIGNPQIGSPEGGGQVIAFLVVCSLLGFSIYWGAKWNWAVWWRIASIFWLIWMALFTTFFTNPAGIESGIWQSLGYWIAQQEVARGNQPWYYYFMLTSVYELLPLIFSVVAFFYYRNRSDTFAHFLIYWCVVNFALYTYASEKMPWLLVNTTLPMLVLSGKFLGEIFSDISWINLKHWKGFSVLTVIPLSILIMWNLLAWDFNINGLHDLSRLAIIGSSTTALIFFGIKSAKFLGSNHCFRILSLTLACILALVGLKAALTASFQNDDFPVELLVYTQTAPDILSILDQIESIDGNITESNQLWVTIDQTSGFTWPWAWYLRNRPKVEFPNHDAHPMKSVPNSSVVITHLNNKASTDKTLGDSFTKGERFKHRWWFPEYRYRDVTLRKIFPMIINRSTWINIVGYYLNRDGVAQDIGSEDAVVYYAH